jgi:hypothetical protein
MEPEMEPEFVYRMEKSEAEAALGFSITDEEWVALVAAMEIDEYGPAMAAFVCEMWNNLQVEGETDA